MSRKYSLIFYQYKITQYNSLNVKLSNSQLSKLKSEIKNENEVVLTLSSEMIGDNKTSFPHKILLTDRQVVSLHKSFGNNSSLILNSGIFLGRLLGPLLKTGLPLIIKM